MCPSPQCKPCIIVHGGAWNVPSHLTTASLKGVRRAVCAGYSLLDSGKSAVDAVEAAVRVMEDDPAFDAGYGSCLNEEGGIEMDAVVMTDSHERGVRLGAVAAVGNVRNPVTLARKVMEDTEHCLIVGQGAEKFAKESGVDIVNGEVLITEEMRKEWKRFGKYDAAVSGLFNGGKIVEDNGIVQNGSIENGTNGGIENGVVENGELENSGHDTVGAVAIDYDGRIAVATSTGGITSSKVGRVGDSPIVGCGAFCDISVGGVSVTGHGEGILKCTLSRLVCWLMENGCAPEEAAKQALMKMKKKTASCGGVVVMDMNGNMAHSFTTERMVWAMVDKQGITSSGIDE